MTSEQASLPPVVSRDEWLAARVRLLAKEKDATRARDALSAERRQLPMVRVDKEYVFDSPRGKVTLADMFDGRRQLIIHHVMFDPSREAGCPHCRSSINDLGYLPHLHEKNTTLALVSRAPQKKIDAYKADMGWDIPYYSSYGSDFNYDFHVTLDEEVTPVVYNYRTKAEHEQYAMPWYTNGELPGVSVFLREGDALYHTYSTYARGVDNLLFSLNYLDLTPLGRQ